MTSDDGLTALLHQQMPLTETLGFTGVSASSDEVRLRASWNAAFTTVGGILHGGFLMSLADAAAAACAFFNLPPDATTSTIEAKTNFLRGVEKGDVTAIATPVHVGSSTIVLQTDIIRDDGKLVVRTTQTQAVLAASR